MPYSVNPFTGEMDSKAVAGSGGMGDVIGPASSIDGNFASFDGVSGKLIEDSGFAPDDFLQVANNLSDLSNVATARTSLGLGTVAVLNTVGVANGGTGITTYATGDLIYATALNTLGKLGAGTNTHVLTLSGGVPIWAAPATSGTVTSVSGTANRITSTGGATPVIDISTSYVGQNTITTLGTITTGTWSGTAISAIKGGTGLTSYTTGDLIYASAANTLSKLPIGSNTQVLTLAAGVPTWAAPATSGTMTSLTGNSGVATASSGTVNVVTANSTAKFVGSGSTITQDFGLTNLILGSSAASISTAIRNCGFGSGTLPLVSSGAHNTAAGFNALTAISTQSLNTGLGAFALTSCVSDGNTAVGYNALANLTSNDGCVAVGSGSLTANLGANCTAVGKDSGAFLNGANNTLYGFQSAYNLLTGANNLILGYAAGSGYTSSESSNLLIGNLGTTAESNVLRIGTQGSGVRQQNQCFIAGIVGVTNSSAQMVTVNSGTGQLGVATIPTGTVTSVTGTANQVAVATGTTTPVISLIGPYTPATYTAHGILIGEGTSSIVALGAGTAGQVLQSGGASADPSYSTSTYPSTNAINTLLYASSANVMSALATANSGVLTTSTSGVPSIDTTNFAVLTTGVQMKGNNTNTTPPAGFIGQTIRGQASGVTLVTVTPKTITSISVTAGIWDISGISDYVFSVAGGFCITGISTNNNSFTGTVSGDSQTVYTPTTATILQFGQSIPSFRVLLSATTTYYLVANCSFASGTGTAAGRISATRVG